MVHAMIVGIGMTVGTSDRQSSVALIVVFLWSIRKTTMTRTRTPSGGCALSVRVSLKSNQRRCIVLRMRKTNMGLPNGYVLTRRASVCITSNK